MRKAEQIMTTVPTTVEAVTWDELSNEDKQSAKELYAWDEHWDNKQISKFFEERVAEWGFPTGEISWSLSYCQGDGMAFYGQVYLEVYVRKIKQLKHFRPLFAESSDVHANITKNSFGFHYSHWNTMTAEVHLYDGETPRRNQLADELEERLSEDIKTLSRALEKEGYEIIDSHHEDNYMKGLAEANEWAFDPDTGKISQVSLPELLETRERNRV